jgi:hypothetical protein
LKGLLSANLSNADLRYCSGLRLDDTKILNARFTPRSVNWLGRFFNLLFIYSKNTDPWSELRHTYTGPNFLITLLALIGFLLPYIFQIATWRSINIAQELTQETLVSLQTEYDELVNRGIITPSVAITLGSTIERLKSDDMCLAKECRSYRIWQLLIGVNKGWQFVALTLAIILYNALRYNLTQTVVAFREEEERSGYTPALKEYFTPNRFGLSPTRLHVILKILFWVAFIAFTCNLIEVLFTVVKLRL